MVSYGQCRGCNGSRRSRCCTGGPRRCARISQWTNRGNVTQTSTAIFAICQNICGGMFPGNHDSVLWVDSEQTRNYSAVHNVEILHSTDLCVWSDHATIATLTQLG